MSECVRRGKTFQCGMADAGAPEPCWCTTLPPLPASQLGREAAGCYCPECLRTLLAGAHGDAGVS